MRFVLMILFALLIFTSCSRQHLDMPKGQKVISKNGKYPTAQCQKELASSLEVDPFRVVDKIRVFKSKRIMELHKGNKVLYRFPISLGKNPKGHKLRQGDFKTPIGRYKIVQKRCDAKYYRSILISYPDQEDIERGRKNGVNVGSGITIHAQLLWNSGGHGDRYSLKRDWTNGCIALTNGAMDILWKSLKVQTPIEIYP